MKNSILILLVICIVSCTSNTIFKEPKDLISKDSMVLLLTDLYLATSAKVYDNKFGDRKIDYTFLVYEKYGIDSSRFKKSNYYYTTKIDEYEKIYKDVESKLKNLNTNYKKIKKVNDSIRKDSISNSRILKDSIIKIKRLKSIFRDSIMNSQIRDSLRSKKLKTYVDSLVEIYSTKIDPEQISKIIK